MYIREDLVYNKHIGKVIGFTDLGNINNHLLSFERSVNEGEVTKSILAIMVKGLFTVLKFPYIQFPCTNISGDMLFDPFWKT